MLTIRLQRVGKKHDPSFRVVAVDSRKKTKSGNTVEVVGFYDARKGKTPVRLDADRIKYWISRGAQPSDTVRNLLISKRVIEGAKADVLPRKKMRALQAERAGKAEEAPTATTPAAETPAETAAKVFVAA